MIFDIAHKLTVWVTSFAQVAVHEVLSIRTEAFVRLANCGGWHSHLRANFRVAQRHLAAAVPQPVNSETIILSHWSTKVLCNSRFLLRAFLNPLFRLVLPDQDFQLFSQRQFGGDLLLFL